MSNQERAGHHLQELLATKGIVVVCGAGGVGKTTVAAALALGVVRRHRARVLLITVDPARRLADALGLEELDNEPRPLPAAFFEGAPPVRGELWAAMLDTGEAWDALIARHAPDAAGAAAIVANPFYRNLTRRFARGHEYIAMERLYELHGTGEWDLIVVDTPPALGALDFLDAPERLASFFSSRLLRWLTAPARSRLVGLASRPFALVADRILGSAFLEALGDFFRLLEAMHPGFVERARAVTALLRSERCTYLLVTSPEPAPVAMAREFVAAFATRGLELGALVANRQLPRTLADEELRRAAEVLVEEAATLAGELASQWPGGVDERHLAQLLGELGERLGDYGDLALAESQRMASLAGIAHLSIDLPRLTEEVVEAASLSALAAHLFGEAGAAAR